MRILAIESSARAASVALVTDGSLTAQYFQASGLTHSRTLLSMTEDMLTDLELTVRDVDVIAVAAGPGSFTGVRIGVAAAKGLAWGAEKPVCGVSTLEAMAWQLSGHDGAVICAAMDARRGEIYNALFTSKGDTLTRLTPDRAIPISELVSEAKKDKKPYFFVGDGAHLCYNEFLRENLPAFLPPEPLLLQTAWGVARAARDMEPEPAFDLQPRYLRLSQAERERLQRLEKNNLNGG